MVLLDLSGALTSKPYAFVARPWELRNVDSIDLLDAVGSNLSLGVRGSTVLRILPRVNERVNEEWITDKARFSYDALALQRMVYSSCRGKRRRRVRSSWEKFVSFVGSRSTGTPEFFRSSSRRKKGQTSWSSINLFVGPFVDYDSILSIERMAGLFRLISVQVFGPAPARPDLDFRSGFLFKGFSDLSPYKVCLLVSCNPRLESPSFSLRLRRAIDESGLSVFSLGPSSSLGLPALSLGNSPRSLLALVEGRSCLSLPVSSSTMVLVGGLWSSVFYYPLLSLGLYVPLDLNILHREASSVGLLEAGISSAPRSPIDSGFDILLNEDRIRPSPSQNLLVFTGHHHPSLLDPDWSLPTPPFSERTASHYNTAGESQSTRFSYSPALSGDARDESMVLARLALRTTSLALPPRLSGSDHRPPLRFVSSRIHNTPHYFYMKDFYRNDPLTRFSPVMALASARFSARSSIFQDRSSLVLNRTR